MGASEHRYVICFGYFHYYKVATKWPSWCECNYKRTNKFDSLTKRQLMLLSLSLIRKPAFNAIGNCYVHKCLDLAS